MLLDLYRATAVIDGFRIDHPDGLADPEGYLEQLRDATDGAWVVVEKILAVDEQLPLEWPTARHDRVRRVAPTSRRRWRRRPAVDLDELWRRVVRHARFGRPTLAESLAETERAAKRVVIEQLMQPEVRRLVRRAVEAARDRRPSSCAEPHEGGARGDARAGRRVPRLPPARRPPPPTRRSASTLA